MLILGSFLSIEFFWGICFFILDLINKHSSVTLNSNDETQSRILIIVVLIIGVVSIISGIVVGIYYNPIITKSTNLDRIEISEIPVNRFYGVLPANFIYNTTFQIKFGFIKWADIESNYTIIQAYDSDNISNEYKWNGTTISLRGNDKNKVTLFESKTQNISKNFYVFSKKYSDSYQEWNITLNNTNKAKIIVSSLDFLPYAEGDEKLRLINISTDVIYYRGSLFENINKSLGSNGFTIFNVVVEPNEKRYITLYFGQ